MEMLHKDLKKTDLTVEAIEEMQSGHGELSFDEWHADGECVTADIYIDAPNVYEQIARLGRDHDDNKWHVFSLDSHEFVSADTADSALGEFADCLYKMI